VGNPSTNFSAVLAALDQQAGQLTERISDAIGRSDAVQAKLPAEERQRLAARMWAALREAIERVEPTPLIDLLSEGMLQVPGSSFSDTQKLFAISRRSLMETLPPSMANDPRIGIELVDTLGVLLGAAREAEVERVIGAATRHAEQQTQELRGTLHRLEQSFLTSPLGTLEADNQGIIRRWNPAAERIFGWSADEAIGKNALELLVPGLAREHVANIIGALLSGQAADSRNVNTTKSGKLITCQWNNAVLRDEQGAVIGWLSQTQDITEQLRAEEELRTSEARLRAVIANLPVVMFAIDSEGVFTMSDGKGLDLLGLKPGQVVGQSLFDVYRDIPTIMNQTRDALTGNPSNEIAVIGPLVFENYYEPLRDERGQVSGAIGVAFNITDRYRAQEQLAESQRQVNSMLRNLPGMAYRCINDGQWTMSLVSDGAFAITGYPASDFTDSDGQPAKRSFSGLLLADDRQAAWEVIQAGLSEGKSFTVDYRIRHADGTERWVWEQGSGVYGPGGELLAMESFVTDITKQRQAEIERVQLQERVIEAQRSALREISTPIIPLGEGVIAMPLIGTIDSQRAQQVIEALLEGVSSSRATTAILDITGVQVVDTQVANALLRAAQAVKLLGAQVIITGIRPEVAQILVSLGLDLSGIITLANLQGGIQYALTGRHR
jgi:rsbT co-antagonist protein RsbR